jgi:hypothetical protein
MMGEVESSLVAGALFSLWEIGSPQLGQDQAEKGTSFPHLLQRAIAAFLLKQNTS